MSNTIIFEIVTSSIMSRCDFGNSHISAQNTPYAAFGGLTGWLLNWKFKSSSRLISNIANYAKYIFLDDDGIDNVTL